MVCFLGKCSICYISIEPFFLEKNVCFTSLVLMDFGYFLLHLPYYIHYSFITILINSNSSTKDVNAFLSPPTYCISVNCCSCYAYLKGNLLGSISTSRIHFPVSPYGMNVEQCPSESYMSRPDAPVHAKRPNYNQ